LIDLILNLLQRVKKSIITDPNVSPADNLSTTAKNPESVNASATPHQEPMLADQPASAPGSVRSKRKPRAKKPPSQSRQTEPVVEPAVETAPWDMDQFQVPLVEGQTRFHDLPIPIPIPTPVMRAIFELGFTYCTPIQTQIIPQIVAGRDTIGRAQTGTGKTAAFLVGVLIKLISTPITGKRAAGTPRVLIIAPTRELVLQITDEAKALAKFTDIATLATFGGMEYQKQQQALHNRQIDIVVATPGRLIDFMQKKEVHLSGVETLILDEADRMLDMGFIPDVRRIIAATPPKKNRQTLFFSATIPDEIVRLANNWTKDAVVINIEPEQVEVDTVEQIIYIITSDVKNALLYNLIHLDRLERVMVFCNRRDETLGLSNFLKKQGIECAMISGAIAQTKRIQVLDDFKAGRIKVLVATDVAGRGIHIDGVSHVINYTLPRDPEDYVHRIGRTGRAGSLGTSISFACEDDSFYLPGIEKFIGHSLTCVYPDPKYLEHPKNVGRSKYAERPQTTDAQTGDKPQKRRRPRKPVTAAAAAVPPQEPGVTPDVTAPAPKKPSSRRGPKPRNQESQPEARKRSRSPRRRAASGGSPGQGPGQDASTGDDASAGPPKDDGCPDTR
jgi:ATP-dependent RNA helicase RhlB